MPRCEDLLVWARKLFDVREESDARGLSSSSSSLSSSAELREDSEPEPEERERFKFCKGCGASLSAEESGDRTSLMDDADSVCLFL